MLSGFKAGAISVSFLALSFGSCARAQSDSEAGRERVERIISTLASDEMQGRRTFTGGIDKAAAFIESEYAEIGLDTLAGLDSYRQDFTVFQLRAESQTILLNGAGIPRDRAFFVPHGPEIRWTSPSGITTRRISTREDLRGAFMTARRGEVGGLYLVDFSLNDMFERYRGFVAGGMRTLSPGEKAGSAFILTKADRATSLSVTAYFGVEELALANVVGTIPGRRDDEIVVFSAHYDHIGITTPVEGDSIANGANDDASGTTAVIELARHFKRLGTPERTLIFVAFTAEEMGGYGSQYFSKQLDPDRIVAMFNIEMIGKPAVSGPNSAWITGFDRSDFGRILQEAVQGTEYEFYADPYPDRNLFYRSDNATLARLGVPAHSISTTPIDVDQDYHKVSDEVETLDLDHLANTIRAVAAGAETIVSGEATPTRIDPDTVE